MQRFLLGFVASLCLLGAGPAGAITLTSHEAGALESSPPNVQLFSLTSSALQVGQTITWVTPSERGLSLRDSSGAFGVRSFVWAEVERWRGHAPRTPKHEFFRRFAHRRLDLAALDGKLYNPRMPARFNDPVPEPGTGLLFGAGLLGLGLWRRGRR